MIFHFVDVFYMFDCQEDLQSERWAIKKVGCRKGLQSIWLTSKRLTVNKVDNQKGWLSKRFTPSKGLTIKKVECQEGWLSRRLTINKVDYQEGWLSRRLTIKKVDHQEGWPSRKLTIKKVDHQEGWLSTRFNEGIHFEQRVISASINPILYMALNCQDAFWLKYLYNYQFRP